MFTTKLSTKGQIVIPEKIRKEFKVGTAFIASRVDDLIVLKPIPELTKEELKDLKEIEAAWKEIDSGRCKTYTEEEFFEAMKKW